MSLVLNWVNILFRFLQLQIFILPTQSIPRNIGHVNKSLKCPRYEIYAANCQAKLMFSRVEESKVGSRNFTSTLLELKTALAWGWLSPYIHPSLASFIPIPQTYNAMQSTEWGLTSKKHRELTLMDLTVCSQSPKDNHYPIRCIFTLNN